MGFVFLLFRIARRISPGGPSTFKFTTNVDLGLCTDNTIACISRCTCHLKIARRLLEHFLGIQGGICRNARGVTRPWLPGVTIVEAMLVENLHHAESAESKCENLTVK